MNGLRLIEIEIALYFFFLVEVVQEVVTLQYVRLLDEDRTLDAVPAPVLVDRALVQAEVVCSELLLV